MAHKLISYIPTLDRPRSLEEVPLDLATITQECETIIEMFRGMLNQPYLLFDLVRGTPEGFMRYPALGTYRDYPTISLWTLIKDELIDLYMVLKALTPLIFLNTVENTLGIYGKSSYDLPPIKVTLRDGSIGIELDKILTFLQNIISVISVQEDRSMVFAHAGYYTNGTSILLSKKQLRYLEQVLDIGHKGLLDNTLEAYVNTLHKPQIEG